MVGGGFVSPVSEIQLYINLAIEFVLLAIKIYAFASALLYSAESYDAANKLNKATWCAILGVAVLLQLIPFPLTILNLALTVAALVYLADVRPALGSLRRR